MPPASAVKVPALLNWAPLARNRVPVVWVTVLVEGFEKVAAERTSLPPVRVVLPLAIVGTLMVPLDQLMRPVAVKEPVPLSEPEERLMGLEREMLLAPKLMVPPSKLVLPAPEVVALAEKAKVPTRKLTAPPAERLKVPEVEPPSPAARSRVPVVTETLPVLEKGTPTVKEVAELRRLTVKVPELLTREAAPPLLLIPPALTVKAPALRN